MRMFNGASYSIEFCLQISRTQLQIININITELQTSIENTSVVITETAQNVQTLVEALPVIGDQMQGIYQEVPKIVSGIEAIREKLKVSRCKCLETAAVCTY
jgi:methyl-accepting chemotaxis protein